MRTITVSADGGADPSRVLFFTSLQVLTPSSYFICFSVGNRRFRVLVEAHVQIYNLASSKVEKSVVVMKIVDIVRGCSGVGGFVRKV
jgi:hypothetical protein